MGSTPSWLPQGTRAQHQPQNLGSYGGCIPTPLVPARRGCWAGWGSPGREGLQLQGDAVPRASPAGARGSLTPWHRGDGRGVIRAGEPGSPGRSLQAWRGSIPPQGPPGAAVARRRAGRQNLGGDVPRAAGDTARGPASPRSASLLLSAQDALSPHGLGRAAGSAPAAPAGLHPAGFFRRVLCLGFPTWRRSSGRVGRELSRCRGRSGGTASAAPGGTGTGLSTANRLLCSHLCSKTQPLRDAEGQGQVYP